MKKITYLIAILLVSAFIGLAGCSGSSDESSGDGDSISTPQEQIVYIVS